MLWRDKGLMNFFLFNQTKQQMYFRGNLYDILQEQHPETEVAQQYRFELTA